MRANSCENWQRRLLSADVKTTTNWQCVNNISQVFSVLSSWIAQSSIAAESRWLLVEAKNHLRWGWFVRVNFHFVSLLLSSLGNVRRLSVTLGPERNTQKGWPVWFNIAFVSQLAPPFSVRSFFKRPFAFEYPTLFKPLSLFCIPCVYWSALPLVGWFQALTSSTYSWHDDITSPRGPPSTVMTWPLK
jgi:hypothetical protein